MPDLVPLCWSKKVGPGVHVQHDVGAKWNTLHVPGGQGHMGVEMAGDGAQLNKAHAGQKMSCRVMMSGLG